METENETPVSSFLSDILKPGSSLQPVFLLVVDAVLAALLAVLLVLAFLTEGNVHVLALTGIELCLWASVKWFVAEFKKTQSIQTSGDGTRNTTEALNHPKQE